MVDGVVVSETVGTKKPAADIFELAASEVGANLSAGWMVGDSAHHDILGARRLGLRTAWIHRGRVWDPDLAKPDIIVDDLSELAAQIDATPLRSAPIALPIRTERLVLHALSELDIDAVHAILGDRETTRSVSFGQPDRAATAGHVRRRIEQQRTLGFSMWAVRVSGSDEIVGLCGFFPHDDTTVELGYVTRADHWRNGYATEAASVAVDAATGVGLDVMATIRPANAGSLEVAHRAGLVRGETITDDRGELVVFRA